MPPSRKFFLPALLALSLSFPALAQVAGLQVIVSPVRQMRLADSIEAIGTLRANESAQLTASTTDTITEIRFNDGQRVKAGDVLVVMNSGEQFAERSEARAAVAEARRQYERVQDLAKRGTASASLLDQRKRELDTAQARLDATQARVRDRQIVAPFDGIVGLRNVSVGSLLTPGTVVTSIHDDSVMKLDFTVPEVFLATVATGQRIEAASRAFPGEVFTGEVVGISNEVDTVTRAFRVRAQMPNPDRKLRPGMLMTLIIRAVERDALMVPEEALVTRGREHSVFVVRGGDDAKVAERIEVHIGTRVKGAVEIVEGLTGDEQIVTHGAFRLAHGDRVRVLGVDDGSRPLSDLLKRDGGSADK